MSDSPDAVELDDIHEVIQQFDLTDVKYYGMLAQRRRPGDDSEGEQVGELDLKTRTAAEPGALEARFRASLTTDDAELSVDMSVIFTSNNQVTIAEPVMAQFLSDVALMAAYPYIRESILTSAARLGVDRPVLGLMRRGDVELPVPTEPA